MPTALDALYLAALTVASPWLLHRAIATGRYRSQLFARFLGRVRVPPLPPPRVWFHGVSVGEIHMLRGVVARARQRRPDWSVVVSSTSEAGTAEAHRAFADLPVIPWPLDFSWAVANALDAVRPDLLVLAESELWPGLLRAAGRRSIPVAVINGRLSPRSYRRYRRLKWLAAPWLRRVSRFAVQTDEYARHLLDLGVPAERVRVTGSVKYDGAAGDRANPRTAELRRLFNIRSEDLVWVCGSTQDPEEAIALDVWSALRPTIPNLRLVVVPRHAERFDAVADLIESRGLACVRRRQLKFDNADRRAVILLDTIGELSAAWGLADLAFVGGSLDGKRGGQNMIEPAAYGAAVMFGPHTWNFRSTVDLLLAGNAAVRVEDGAGLLAAVTRFCHRADERRRAGEAARLLVKSQQGATERTLDVLEELLPQAWAAGAA